MFNGRIYENKIWKWKFNRSNRYDRKPKKRRAKIYPVDDYREPSVCDDCEIGDGWECQFCCSKCYEDYGECPNPDCDPMDI